MGRHQYRGSNYRGNLRNDQGRRPDHNQHDDRADPNQQGGRGGGGGSYRVWKKDGRHVSFKDRGGPGGGGGGGRGGIRKRGSKARRVFNKQAISLEVHEDDERGSGPQAGRARPAQGSVRSKYGIRGRLGGRGAAIRRGIGLLPEGSGSWHKVSLVNASRYPKEEVLSSLVNALPAVAPLGFAKHGMNFVFHVETRQQATALAALDKRIALSGGAHLGIRTEPSAPPQMSINDEAIDKIKLVMSNRYNPANKALDLKSFHADRSFLGESVYAPLYRGALMKKVVGIIGENIPEVEAIDLSENRLPTLDAFAGIVTRAPKVHTVHLAKNRINDMKELLFLRDLKLVDMTLEGNPFISRTPEFSEHSRLVSSVRKIFPTLQRLDGKELPKLIGFEGDDDVDCGTITSLPKPITKMTVDENVEAVILQFLQEYLKVYDSQSREPLMNAYHEEALMSMSCSHPSRTLSIPEKLNEYIPRSRNLFRVERSDRRKALLKQGRLSVVSFLNELPRSTHDFNSFTLDVPFTSQSIMTFVLSGIFKEEGHNQPVIRHFSRMFVVVPQGSGFVIVNEELHITCATRLQIKNSLTDLGSASASNPSTVDANTMRQMIESLSKESDMNNEWAKKCLEQTNWNYNQACAAFKSARDEGKIPLEAYEK